MLEEFIPYEIALKIRDLGFGNTRLELYWGCFAYYGTDNSNYEGHLIPNNTFTKHSKFDYSQFVNAPLWQQAFGWFKENYNLDSYVKSNGIYGYYFYINEKEYGDESENCGWGYSKARQKCLEKLIDIVKTQ